MMVMVDLGLVYTLRFTAEVGRGCCTLKEKKVCIRPAAIDAHFYLTLLLYMLYMYVCSFSYSLCVW